MKEYQILIKTRHDTGIIGSSCLFMSLFAQTCHHVNTFVLLLSEGFVTIGGPKNVLFLILRILQHQEKDAFKCPLKKYPINWLVDDGHISDNLG